MTFTKEGVHTACDKKLEELMLMLTDKGVGAVMQESTTTVAVYLTMMHMIGGKEVLNICIEKLEEAIKTCRENLVQPK